MQSFTFSVILFGVAATSWAQRTVAVILWSPTEKSETVEE